MENDKILIVEDHHDTRYILEKFLTKNNFIVNIATNGVEALKILENFFPKVILADWTMPKMDGLKLCDILKKHEKYKIIYYILLTARATLKDKVTGLEIGADDFLVKPVENQELMARIRSGIRIYNLQNELKNIEHKKAIVQMACTIGHQINNPLSSLVITLQNLEQELKSKDKSKTEEDFQIINESIERIKKLVETLMNIDNPELVSYTSDKQMLKLE